MSEFWSNADDKTYLDLEPPVDLSDILVWIEQVASTQGYINGYVAWTENDESNLQALIDTVYERTN